MVKVKFDFNLSYRYYPTRDLLHKETKMAFEHADFYRLDDKLTEEEKMLRNTLRDFLRQDRVKNILRSCNIKENPIPMELIKELAGLGVIGVNIPDENGEKPSNRSYGIITREVEYIDSALRSFVSVQSSLVIYPIWRYGSDEQKKKWLSRLCSVEAIGCFGLTESYGGSNPMGMRTVAEEKPDCYILNGSKNWITNSPSADVAIIWARYKNDIKAFLVEKGTPGYETQHIKNKASLRASNSGSISLQDCKIPKENMLPGADGIKSAFSCLNKARYGIAWGTAGIVLSCYEKITELLKDRSPFGQPLDSRQLVQADLALIDANLVDILSRVFRLAELADQFDEGKISEVVYGQMISQAKYHCVELAYEAVNKCRKLAGADGLTYEYPFVAHLANLWTLQTYEGTENIHLLIQGQRITGKSSF